MDHEQLKRVCRKTGVNKVGRRIAGEGKMVWKNGRERLTGDLLCVSLSWKSGTWTYAKRCVSAKSIMSKSKRRKVRIYRWTGRTIRGQACCCVSWMSFFLLFSQFVALKTAASSFVLAECALLRFAL